MADRHLVDFKLCPILPTARRPPRLYLAWTGEPAAWTARVQARFPQPEVAAFLASVPGDCRRMIDTDGETAELYLDDLHLHGHPEMCRVLAVPAMARSHIVLAEAPPTALRPLLAPLLAVGGMVAVREGGPTPRALWVSEARWKDRVGVAREALRAAGLLPPAVDALDAALAPLGLQVYVDGVDAWDGALDITLGLIRRPAA